MNYSYLISNVQLSPEKLSQNGFCQNEKGVWVFTQNLHNGLHLIVKTSGAKLDVDVWDTIVNKRSSAFANGHSGSALRAEVRDIVDALIAECRA